MTPLSQGGHEVVYANDLMPGSTDDAVLKQASDTDSILVTEDKDFGDLVFDRNYPSNGILLIRLIGVPLATKQRQLVSVVDMYGDRITGSISVVTPNGVRIRRISA